MRTKSSLARLLASEGILLLAVACHSPDRRPPQAVVLVSLDTLRPDHLGAYGYAKPTSPEIDRFRRDAVLFREAVANAPSTLPSHASILTSLGPLHHGASLARESGLRSGVPTLASVLKAAGFATASFNGGGQLDRTWGLDRGFDVYVSAAASASADIGDDTMSQQVAAARPWLASVRTKPFFLFLHTYETHHPYTPKPERLAVFEQGYAGRLPNDISIRLIQKINSGRKRLAPGDLDAHRRRLRCRDRLGGRRLRGASAAVAGDGTLRIGSRRLALGSRRGLRASGGRSAGTAIRSTTSSSASR